MGKYFWTNLKYFFKYRLNPAQWIPASILCIRFPFLYPRNRFTGKHYTNWKLHTLKGDAHEKAYKTFGKFGDKDDPVRIEKVSKWWAFVEKFYDGLEDFLGLFHCIPTYTELDAMPDAWRKLFGIQMCKELKESMLRTGGRKLLKRYRITQIKEKYGSLCWYDMGSTEEVQKIIAKYEYISGRTCISCGKPADYITRGWVEPYCEHCLPDHIDKDDDEQVIKFYTKENPWYDHYRI